MKPIHPKILSGAREVAVVMLNGFCEIITRDDIETAYGTQEQDVPFVIDDTFSNELAFWESHNYAEGDNRFPCELQPARAEDTKSLKISEDKLLFWLFLPWYMVEVDKFRLANGRKRLLQNGGSIHIISTEDNSEESPSTIDVDQGTFEIEQVTAITTFKRINVKILVSQRQVI